LITVREILELKSGSIVERSFSPALISITLDMAVEAENTMRKTGRMIDRVKRDLFFCSLRIGML